MLSFRFLLGVGLLALCAAGPAWGQQVGVNTATPHPTAAVDIVDSARGLLPPRLTTPQRDAIVAPAPGLTIYNTTTNCLNYYNGTRWIEICADVAPCTPPPTPVASATPTPTCEGATVQFNSTPVGGATYIWNGPAGFYSTTQNPALTCVGVAQSGVYTLRTWVAGCYSIPDSVTVTISPSGWQCRNAFPGTARTAGIGFGLAGKGYFGTGTPNSGCAFINDWWEYTPATDAWVARTAPPVPVNIGYAGCYTVGGLGYMVAGYYCSVYHKTHYQYNPATDAWITRAVFPGVGRAESFLNLQTATHGYFGNGDAGGCGVNDFYAYDPATNTWAARTTWPGIRREGHVAFEIAGKLYVGLGHEYACAPNGQYADWYEYDPATNTWATKANGPAGQHGAYFAIGGLGYVITNTNQVYRYDPVADTWTLLPCAYPGQAPQDWDTVTLIIGTSAYVVNGRTREVWQFTP